MLDDRKLDVLRAIVEDYVATQEPVGSKALVERHHLGVSPATVRNDMAALEEEGFITQPHTSAGRIPTDKGYRLFVDKLTTVKPLSAAEKRAIATFLQGAVDLDDVVHRSVRLLAQLTQPGRDRAVPVADPVDRPARRGRHADPAPAAAGADHQHRPGRAADRRAAEGPRRRRDRRPARPAEHCRRRPAADRRRRRAGATAETFRADDAPWSRRSSPLRRGVADDRSDEKIAIGGTANLARFGDDFDHVDQAAAGGARGARRPAQAARRGDHAAACHRPHRPRGAVRAARHDLGGRDRLRARRAGAGRPSASSARPGWTIPARWPPSTPSRATSARSWPTPDSQTQPATCATRIDGA